MSAAAPATAGLDLGSIAAGLRQQPWIAQWQITQRDSVRHERYLTFLAVESERESAATIWTVWTATAADNGKQGEASFTIQAGESLAALQESLERAHAAALAAGNPAFELPADGEDGVAQASARDADALADPLISADAPGAVDTLAQEFSTAVAACPWVRPSTLEIFLTTHDRVLLNHRGLHLRERRTHAFAEFVLLHRAAGRDEVEFYHQTEAASLQALALGARVARAARCVRDGAQAGATVPGVQPVVISDEYLAKLLDSFRAHADAGRHASRTNVFTLGDPLLQRRSGPVLTVVSDPSVISLAAYQFDEQGYAPSRTTLIDADRLVGVVGSARWMRLLGRQPRGMAGTLVVPAGDSAAADLLCGALEVVAFSDLAARYDTGAFSGEIRLAYRHHADGRVEAVTGGSVSGVLTQALADCRFSREMTTCAGYHGPRAVRFAALTVAC